jgi:hypothetical protein
MPLEEVFRHSWVRKHRPEPPVMPKEPVPDASKDVMKELEEYVKNKKPQGNSGQEVYEMCDSMLQELDVLESTFGKKGDIVKPVEPPRRY